MLGVAAKAGDVAAFRLLLDAGADVGGMDREASPQEEVRRHCRKPEACAGAAGGAGGQGWRRQGARWPPDAGLGASSRLASHAQARRGRPGRGGSAHEGGGQCARAPSPLNTRVHAPLALLTRSPCPPAARARTRRLHALHLQHPTRGAARPAAPRSVRARGASRVYSQPMAHDSDGRRRRGRRRRGRAAPPSPPFVFLDMPCDLLTCLGPVASTPGYEREMDGLQRLCRTARDDAMLGAATADLRYKARWGGPRSRLRYACSVNDEARVAWLVECGARDVLAAAQPDYKGGEALLRRLAADPLVDATQALAAAARIGVADVVAPLVARGAQLERAVGPVDWRELTALQAASESGQVQMVAALLAAGAAVDAADHYGATALLFAARDGHLEVVQALVAAGADVNMRGWNGRSAAALAAYGKHVPVAAYLCHLPQAEPSAHIVAAAWLGDVALVRDFIARGANVEEAEPFGATCLVLAAWLGHAAVMRALLEAGANMDAGRGNGLQYDSTDVWTYAAGRPVLLAALLEHFEVGGDAWRQEKLNRALAHAVSRGGPEGEECERMLLAAGAELHMHYWF